MAVTSRVYVDESARSSGTKARLKKEHDARTKEHLADMAALARVERLLAESVPSPTGAEQQDNAQTIIGMVESLFLWYPNQTFTVAELVQKLRERNFEFTGDARKSVHTAVWRLAGNGVIRTVTKGKGRTGSTYQRVQNQMPGAPPNGAPTPEMDMKHGAPVPTNLR